MNIFITNDDGIHAKGLKYLIDIAKEFGNVTVVAPDRPQSGMSHAITLSVPMRMHKITEEPGYKAYACNGTPVDCVKLGLKIAMQGIRPDLIISGINHGSNASTNVIYSGTMAAAVEGIMEDIPSLGISLLNWSSQADFSACGKSVRQLIEMISKASSPICLNANIPNISAEEIKGLRFCRQAKATWEETYEMRTDPYHANYYWLTGDFKNTDSGEDTDLFALENGYVSVVPIQFDWTNYNLLKEMKEKYPMP